MSREKNGSRGTVKAVIYLLIVVILAGMVVHRRDAGTSFWGDKKRRAGISSSRNTGIMKKKNLYKLERILGWDNG